MCTSNHHILYFKYSTTLFVNYTSVKLKEILIHRVTPSHRLKGTLSPPELTDEDTKAREAGPGLYAAVGGRVESLAVFKPK